MKMTEASEFETQSLHDFLDDMLNSDFIDEVVNLKCELAPSKNIESAQRDDVDVIKSVKCRKRKLSNADLIDETKQCTERHLRSKSPNIDILKRAVKRLRNADKSNDYTSDGMNTICCGIVSSSNESTVETRQPNRTHLNEKSIALNGIDHLPQHLQKIVSDILKGFKVMIIMRGPPGCGKSFLAREIIDTTTKDHWSDHIFSASDFFYKEDGCFDFNRLHIRKSHQWNQARLNSHARNGWSPIIVDNTNIMKWEMNAYLKTAVQYGYLVEIVHPNTSWSKSPDALVAMNIHDVPRATIERMILNYQSTTVNDLMKSAGLKYTMKMPQYRRLPTLA